MLRRQPANLEVFILLAKGLLAPGGALLGIPAAPVVLVVLAVLSCPVALT